MIKFVLLCSVVLSGLSYAASSQQLEAHKVTASNAIYKGREAIRVVEATSSSAEDKIAILADFEMRNGTISGYISGDLNEGAGSRARGFVGLAFRIDDTVSTFEAIYLRPTNARADDQLRRNHSVQYISYPEFPWHRLRKEAPASYETYADMVPGEWIHYRLEVDGETARLYLNQSEQPALIVNDLKLGERTGRVGLWIGPGTEAHFSNIDVESE